MRRTPHVWTVLQGLKTLQVAMLLAAAAVLETSFVLAAVAQHISILTTVGLHLLLVAAVGYALYADFYPVDGDQAQFATMAITFAGPVGAMLAAYILLSGSRSHEQRAQSPSIDPATAADPIDQLVAQIRSNRALRETTPVAGSLLTLMKAGSVSDQLAVLGVVALNYHPGHQRILSLALRAPAGGVRAQAAALVTSLGVRYKQKYDRAMRAIEDGSAQPDAAAAELVECLRSHFLDGEQAENARLTAISLCQDVIDGAGPRAEEMRQLLSELTAPGSADGEQTGRPVPPTPFEPRVVASC